MLFEILGPWAFAIFGAALAGSLVPLVLGVFVGMKWRPPLFLWLFGPCAVLLAGALGTWSAGGHASDAIAQVDPGQRALIGAVAYGEAVTIAGVGAIAAGALLLFSAVVLSVALAASTRPGRFTFGPAVLSFLISGLTFLGAAVGSFVWQAGVSALVLAFASGLAGLAAAIGGLRAAPELTLDDEAPSADPARIAAGRGGVALLATLAVATLGWGFGWMSESSVYQAVAHVDPAQKATLLAWGLTELTGIGNVLMIGVIGTLAAGVIPAAWSSGDLGTGSPARTAIGFLGTMLTLIVGVGGPFALTSTLSPLLEMASQRELTSALGGLELPEPKGRTADAWAGADGLSGGCLLLPSGTGWAFRPAGGTCPEKVEGGLQEGVVVAASAEIPARLLAQVKWGDQGQELPVVVRRNVEELPIEHPMLDAMAYGIVMFHTLSTPDSAAPPESDNYIVDTAEGVVLGWVDRPAIPAPGDPTTLAAALDPMKSVILVPGPTWTVQDLVSWCLQVQSAHPQKCYVSPTASLYVTPEAPAP
jgi:hypothetical protein